MKLLVADDADGVALRVVQGLGRHENLETNTAMIERFIPSGFGSSSCKLQNLSAAKWPLGLD